MLYYYLQQLNGQYILDDTYHGTAYMDDEIYADMNDYSGFDYPDYEYITITSNPDNNVASYYYDRHMYTLNIGNADFVQTTTPSGEYPYETELLKMFLVGNFIVGVIMNMIKQLHL